MILCSIIIGIIHLAVTADSILLLDLGIPPFVKEGTAIALTCHYDLEYDGLYSLKWYKDDVEFYSYIPRMKKGSKKRFFDLPGVFIDKKQADEKQVVLSNVSILATEGNYKCQVSGEGPLFATAAQTKRLRVAKVPTKPPDIGSDEKVFLKPGDWLNLNCTSEPSRPPTRLTWFVNGLEASDRMIRRFTPSPAIEDMKQIAAIDKTDLTQSVLGLQFWVTSEHFLSSNNGNRKLKVKCRGQIPSVYLEESDTLIVGEHDGPPHKVLQATSGGSRSSFASANILGGNPNQGFIKGSFLLPVLLFLLMPSLPFSNGNEMARAAAAAAPTTAKRRQQLPLKAKQQAPTTDATTHKQKIQHFGSSSFLYSDSKSLSLSSSWGHLLFFPCLTYLSTVLTCWRNYY